MKESRYQAYLFALAAAVLTSFPAANYGQDDPIRDDLEKADGVIRPGPSQVGVLLEWIEMDARAANKLIRKDLSKADRAPNAFRDEVEKLIDSKDATLMDTNFVMTRSGTRAKTESVDEVIYPTEVGSPNLPNTSVLLAAKVDPTAALPSAFEVRNAGPTIEVEPVIDASETVIHLNIAPEWVVYEGRDFVTRTGSPNAELTDVWMPRFNTLNVATAVQLRDGESKMISVATPKAKGKLILVFVQASILR